MSNLAQFYPIGKRVGEIVSLPFAGSVFTASDGTVWKAIDSNGVAYSSSYSGLLTNAPALVTSATQLNGPFSNNRWMSFITQTIVGSTAGGATWVMLPNAGGMDFYYTSTDAGSTWTQRASPVAAKAWTALWDGTNFVAYCQSTGATGVQESTDGITWTARTAISIVVREVIYNGTVYLAVASGNTTCATSPDRTTWTTRTCTTQVGSTVAGLGQVTWNAGAALFVMGTSTAGQYQTSPDGQTWTNRTTLQTIAGFSKLATWAFASDGTTTTIVSGGYGMVAVSTDCVNWTTYDVDSAFFPGTFSAAFAYWDGSRFVLGYFGGMHIYYSSNGTAWTKATRGVLPNLTPIKIPGAVAAIPTNSSTDVGWQLPDVTSSTPNNIVISTNLSTSTVATSYVRVL